MSKDRARSGEPTCTGDSPRISPSYDPDPPLSDVPAMLPLLGIETDIDGVPLVSPVDMFDIHDPGFPVEDIPLFHPGFALAFHECRARVAGLIGMDRAAVNGLSSSVDPSAMPYMFSGPSFSSWPP